MVKQAYVSISRIARPLIPWLCFWTFFAWGWRVRNFFEDLPAYGDVLEVLWGIQWYHDSLFLHHSSPLFTPLVFHPVGWHTATLAHTPVLFLFALPLYRLGGLGFAYNTLSVLALVIAFAGIFRFAQLFVSRTLAIVAALAFTFWQMGWNRVNGHLHTVWASGLLAWLAWSIEQARRASGSKQFRWVIIAGGIWGAMINFSLYGVFIGALAFLLWGRHIFQPRRIVQIIMAGLIALVLSSPTIGLYIAGSWADHTHIYGAEHNMWWGASLNSFFIPSIFHPLEPVRLLARTVYKGPYNESGVMNFGLMTSFLALLGCIAGVKTKRSIAGLVILVIAGIILAMGLLLRWNGEVVPCPVFSPLNTWIWGMGHSLKPEVFSGSPPEPFKKGIPLPGFLLTAFIPFWEGARTVSRYAVLGMLGMVILAGLALERFPKVVRAVLIALWLVEILPAPTRSLPVPLQPHPAYAWLAKQNLKLGEGVADLVYPTLGIDGRILWATILHQKPTASGTGSFWPEHTYELWHYLLSDRIVLSQPQVGYVFQQYGVRYIFLHMGDKEREMWAMIQDNPIFRPVGCFDPLPFPNPWPYPICVAEVKAEEGPIQVLPGQGWSDQEDWGVWAEGTHSTAEWIAVKKRDYVLRLGAFPLCVPGQHQQISIQVNGKQVGSYQWEECELWEAEIPIPASVVKIGWNELSFQYAYAKTPAEVTQGQNLDPRHLSVGFIILEVR